MLDSHETRKNWITFQDGLDRAGLELIIPIVRSPHHGIDVSFSLTEELTVTKYT